MCCQSFSIVYLNGKPFLGNYTLLQRFYFIYELSRNFTTTVMCLLRSYISILLSSIKIVIMKVERLARAGARTGDLWLAQQRSYLYTRDALLKSMMTIHNILDSSFDRRFHCSVAQWGQNISGEFCNLCVSVFTIYFFLVLIYLRSAAE